ncbi:MAG: hypothetical protein P8H13_09565 [Polaribacter sp.]|nr:hypothetical protein [Polaribacter sp.]MDG1812168.1 hypothetical protein [Polaribacter sp.]MDG1994167.1 hypothetical protein [Polaribacter sp.]
MKLAKQNILKLTEEAHKIAEETYRELQVNEGSKPTLEQRQFLLTDMACHLIQDALSDNIMNSQSLKNRLYAILSISDDFLPDKKLKEYADKIIS